MRVQLRSIALFLYMLSTTLLFSQNKFPESNANLGYVYSEMHARVAMPMNGENRIWLKGNSQYNTARLIDLKGNIEKTVNLKAPFFTTTTLTRLNDLKVSFCNAQDACIEIATLNPGHYMENRSENFSILLYGCMEPFMVEKEDGEVMSSLFRGENNSAFRLRKLFNKVSTHQEMEFTSLRKEDNEFISSGVNTSTLLGSRPKLIITTGDQVYVDAGYDTKVSGNDEHPISAWETKRRPYPFNLSTENYTEHLNELYNASYSFNEVEEAHRLLPTLPTIDDHELRDGWGSQGDEYKKGRFNKRLSPFYYLGKSAFIQHQLTLSSYREDTYSTIRDSLNSMHYAFEVNGKNGFVFDLRSARNINAESVLGEKQWQDFEHWLENLEENQEIILVTSIPLTLRPLKLFENILKFFKPELRDDVRDGWSYRKNVAERDRLLSLLTKYRKEKEIKPIFVSGDAHKSALIEIWVDGYADNDGSHDVLETMILGYEIVASGFSHEFVKTGVSKSLFKLTESQRIGDGFIEFELDGNTASIYPMVRSSKVAQNFGAIEFKEDQPTVIHTFVYNNDTDNFDQLSLVLDFTKKLPDEDYYISVEKPNGRIKSEFQPPIPHKKNVITDKND